MDLTYLPEERNRLPAEAVDDVFARLVHDLRPRIVALVHAIIDDAHTAEDIAQETFIKLYDLLRKEAVGRTLPAWVRRVAANAARDHLRRRTAAPDVCPTDELAGLPAPLGLCASRREFCARAIAELDCLRPLDRRICELRIEHGFTFPEISRLTQATVAKTEKTYHRTMRRLLGLWQADTPGGREEGD